MTGAAERIGRVLAALICLLAARTAAAQSTPLDLSWDAPQGCPQLAAVHERVRVLAGASIHRASPLQAQGRISKEDGRFRLRLLVRDGAIAGERNIVSDSCEDLSGAAAVVLGLLLRSEAPLTEGDLRGSDAPSRAAAPEPGSTPGPGGAQAQPEPAQRARAAPQSAGAEPAPAQPSGPSEPPPNGAASARRWRALVRAPALALDFGPLPKPSLGLAFGAGMRDEHWRFLLVGELWWRQTLRATDFPSWGADVGRASAGLRACRGARFGRDARFELAPCLGLGLEHINARGVGPSVAPSEKSATWLAAGASVLGSLRVAGALALIAEAGARVETERPLITIDGLGTVRRLAPLSLATAVGVEWSF